MVVDGGASAKDRPRSVFVHPKQTKAIASARLKSDKVDALMLAKLLKADLLPRCGSLLKTNVIFASF